MSACGFVMQRLPRGIGLTDFSNLESGIGFAFLMYFLLVLEDFLLKVFRVKPMLPNNSKPLFPSINLASKSL